MDDLISRRSAIDAVRNFEDCENGYSDTYDKAFIISALEELPSVQQGPKEFEWCRDCAEYDQIHYCCHRWTKVIRQTVKELREGQTEAHWIPCSERLPDRFGQVLCTFIPAGGTLWTSVIIAHYSDLMGISKPCFWIGDVGKNSFQNITKQVTAWMPLPAPYREEGERNEQA